MAIPDFQSPAGPEEVAAVSKDAWLGGEPNLLDLEVEKKGIDDILAALTEEEVNEMKDKTMPIRHFRAEKVSSINAILLQAQRIVSLVFHPLRDEFCAKIYLSGSRLSDREIRRKR